MSDKRLIEGYDKAGKKRLPGFDGELENVVLDNISPLLLGYLLNKDNVNKQKSSMAQGDAVVHIYSKHVSNHRFKIPLTLEEQDADQILSDMDRELQTFLQKRERYVQINQVMMQELLTGKVRLV